MWINNKEILCLPPFGNNQGLEIQEIKEIVFTILNKEFEVEIDYQKFDPSTTPWTELFLFVRTSKKRTSPTRNQKG